MLDFDAGKLIIVGVIALIFIPPKDLPRVLRQAGQFVGRMRRMASEFQGQFMDAMREADMADLRKEAHKLADSARVDLGLDAIDDDLRTTGKTSKWDDESKWGDESKWDDAGFADKPGDEAHGAATVADAKRLAVAAASPPEADKADPPGDARGPERATPVAQSG